MSDLNLNSLYQQLILDHYRKPRNKGELPEKTVEIHMANPVCGDEIRLQLQIEGDRIVQARHVGQGCSISQAAVSMMTQLIKEKKLSEAAGLAQRFTEMMHSAGFSSITCEKDFMDRTGKGDYGSMTNRMVVTATKDSR